MGYLVTNYRSKVNDPASKVPSDTFGFFYDGISSSFDFDLRASVAYPLLGKHPGGNEDQYPVI